MQKIKNKLILALDTNNYIDALYLTDKLKNYLGLVKVGLELFLSHPGIVERLTEKIPVFLDLKLHDIPETVKKAVKTIQNLNPYFLTIHSSSGPEVLKAAVENVSNIKILAVTELTSVKQTETTLETVLTRSGYAQEANCFGVIASGLEAKEIREKYKNLKIITPGIRLKTDAPNDQKRIVTPTDAIKNGSDYLVVGRSILNSVNPVLSTQKILEEIEKASSL